MLSRLFTATVITSAFLMAITGEGQTIIQNEKLVNSTLVVITNPQTAECFIYGCRVSKPLLDSIPVTCPGVTGQTCTLHIALDLKVSMGPESLGVPGSGFYQFLVDGAAPDLGPTGKNGVYLLEQNVYTFPGFPPNLQSFPSSVLATVTNSDSDQHTISVRIGCKENGNGPGCKINTHHGTMRIDAFQP